MSEEEALSTPYGLAQWDYLVHLERNGTIKINTQAHDDLMDAAKKDKAETAAKASKDTKQKK